VVADIANLRIGTGYDFHRLVTGRELILGGVKIDFIKGLAGHSDADVLIHSIIDSLLGAASEPDIGAKFPDSDPRYSGISSLVLLSETAEILKKKSVKIINIDSVIICEKPKLLPYIDLMKKNICAALALSDISRMGIKAKTAEGAGVIGEGGGIEVHSTALIYLS
jgi:2-C-methyl-D-erythritol 2,4-cyclodiphosphate synthase